MKAMMLSVILATAVALVGAEPEAPKSKQVEFAIRVCRGDPKGSVDAKTIEVLSRPTITTIMDHPGYVFFGREVPVLRGDNVEYLQFGIKVQITARSIDKRTGEVEVEFEDSSREGTPKLRAAMSGRVSRGEPIRLFLQTPPGEARMWAEVIVDKAAR
jgi:hypothetical protein